MNKNGTIYTSLSLVFVIFAPASLNFEANEAKLTKELKFIKKL